MGPAKAIAMGLTLSLMGGCATKRDNLPTRSTGSLPTTAVAAEQSSPTTRTIFSSSTDQTAIARDTVNAWIAVEDDNEWMTTRKNYIGDVIRRYSQIKSQPNLWTGGSSGGIRLNMDSDGNITGLDYGIIFGNDERLIVDAFGCERPQGPDQETVEFNRWLVQASVNEAARLEACGWPAESIWASAGYTSSSSDSATATSVPFFPWPPPAPNGFIDLTGKVSVSGRFAEIARRAEAKLTGRGYDKLLYFGVPGGFAITTELERFAATGEAEMQRRFVVGKVAGWRGLWDYLRRLVQGDAGRFRVFVIVVTSTPFSPATYPAGAEDIARWRSTGTYSLPPAVASTTAPAGTRVTLMVYEFEGSRSRLPGLAVPAEHLPISTHTAWLGF